MHSGPVLLRVRRPSEWQHWGSNIFPRQHQFIGSAVLHVPYGVTRPSDTLTGGRMKQAFREEDWYWKSQLWPWEMKQMGSVLFLSKLVGVPFNYWREGFHEFTHSIYWAPLKTRHCTRYWRYNDERKQYPWISPELRGCRNKHFQTVIQIKNKLAIVGSTVERSSSRDLA